MTIIITMLWRMKFELEDVEMELEHSGCISRWGLHLSALLTMMKVLLEAAAAMMTAVTVATGWRSHINIRCNKDAHLPRIA